MNKGRADSGIPDLSQVSRFEDILDVLGGFGRFQILILILLLILEIPVAFVTFIPIFVGGGNDDNLWQCGIELLDKQSFCLRNISTCLLGNGTTLILSANNPIQPSSIVSEWGLICNKAWVSDFILSIQMLGMFLGNIYGSQFADWYGRRKGFLVATILLILGSSVSAIAPNPYIYAGARFLCGAGIPAFINITTMAVIEFMPPKYRSLSASIGPTGEGIMLLSILAYFIRPWRNLYWATLSPFFLIIVIYPFVPESPRWLLRNGKIKEAEKVLNYMAKVNSVIPISRALLHKISLIEQSEAEANSNQTSQMGKNDQKRFGYSDLFKDPSLRRICFSMMAIWFAWSFTYYGISYNIRNVQGNIYINVFLMGLANALGQRSALLINDRLGRRKSLFISMTFSAIWLVALALCEIFLSQDKDSNLGLLVLGLCLLAQFGMSAARSAARLLSGENFPTPVRTMGLGLGGIAANFAGIVTPQLTYVGSNWPAIPIFVFAAVSVGGSLVAFLLTETNGQPLSDNVIQEQGIKTNNKSIIQKLDILQIEQFNYREKPKQVQFNICNKI